MLVFVVLAVLPWLVLGGCPPHPPPDVGLCDLACFLPNATFVLPDLQVAGVVSLSSVECFGVSFSALSSLLSPDGDPSVSITFGGFGLSCSAHASLFHAGDVAVSLELGPDSSLSVTLVLTGGGDGTLPSSVTAKNVEADLHFVSKSGLSQAVLHAIRSEINSYAERHLTLLVEQKGTSLVQELARMAAQPMPGFAPLPDSPPSDSLDVEHSVVAGLFEAARKMDGFVRRAAGMLNGLSMAPEQGYVVPAQLPGVCAWFNVSNVSVSAFDAFEVDLFTDGELGVSSNVSLSHFEMAVDAKIILTSSFGSDIVLDVHTKVEAKNPVLASGVWLSISERGLHETLFASQLSTCLVHNASYRGLQLVFDEGLVSITLQQEGSSLQAEVFDLINNLNGVFVRAYGPHIPVLLAMAVSESLPNVINERFQALLEVNSRNCPSGPLPRSVSDPYDHDQLYLPDMIVFWSFVGSCSAVWLLLSLAPCFGSLRKSDDVGDDEGDTTGEHACFILAVFFLLFTVALYCSGSASNQAWVWVGLRGSTESGNGTFVSSPVMAVLSFGSLVTDSWNAGAYFNSVGLVLTGMVLPVVRALMFVCVVACSKWKKDCYPLRLSSFLEFCGKFGGFVSTDGGLAKTAFSLVMPLSAIASTTAYVYMYPAGGFYLFMAANLTGLIGGEFALWYVRRRCLRTKSESLLPVSFSLSSSSTVSSWGTGFTLFVLFLVVAGGGLTLAGIVLPCLRFTMGGAAAEALRAVDSNSAALDRSYSVIDLAASLRENVLSYWGNSGILSGFVVMTSLGIAVPLATPLVVLVGMFLRFKSKVMLALMEIARASNGTETWLIALLASYLSIEQLGTFIVGPTCVGIDALLLQYPSVFPEAAGRCLKMVASLLAGTYLLLAGSVLMLTGSFFVISQLAHDLLGGPVPWWMRKLRQWKWISSSQSGVLSSYELFTDVEEK